MRTEEQLETLVQVEEFSKCYSTPKGSLNIYKMITNELEKEWTKLNSSQRITIASHCNLTSAHITLALKSTTTTSLSVKTIFRLCYIFNKDLIIVKGEEKVVLSFNNLSHIGIDIVHLNKIIRDVMEDFPASYLIRLTGYQYTPLAMFKDVLITRRSFIRYIHLGMNLGLEFYLVDSTYKKEEYKYVS